MPAVENLHLGANDAPSPQAYFVRTAPTVDHGDNRWTSHFASTVHSQGAWQPGEQHLAVAAGLLINELETLLPADKAISRLSFDVLGVIASGEFTVETTILRPGRTIELVEVAMKHGERTAIAARIWRLQPTDTSSVAGQEFPALPARAECHTREPADWWPGGYIASLSGAEAPGGRPGRNQVWITSPLPLVEGEADQPYAALLKFGDTANGLAVRADPATTFFANVDLSIHMFRQPVGAWLGFDVRVAFGPTGLGLTSTVLHDDDGPCGTIEQSLTVRMGRGE